MGMPVALGAEGPPEEVCSKWRNLEGCGLKEVPHIQAYLPWKYSDRLLLQRWRSLHIFEPAEQSGSTTWGEPAERLLYMYSEVLGGSSGDRTLLLWLPLAAGVRQSLESPSQGTAWVAMHVDLLLCPELDRLIPAS